MYDYRVMSVMSDRHQIEHRVLERIANHEEWSSDIGYMKPALVSRMNWLEYQAELKMKSILMLCKTGK